MYEQNKKLSDLLLGERKTKAQMLAIVNAIEPNDDIIEAWNISSGKGSSYGADQIRITGSPEFLIAVLSRMKDILILENRWTRIDLAHSIVQNTEINGEKKHFTCAGGHCLYIKYQERGKDIAGAGFNPQGTENASEEFLNRKPGLREEMRKGKIWWLMFLGMSKEDAIATVDKKKEKK
jgi:hypothetical protein